MCKFTLNNLVLKYINNIFKNKIQKNIMEACNCFDVDYPVYDLNKSTCLEVNFPCNSNFLSNFEENNTFKKACEIECPFECDRIGNEVFSL